MTNLPNAVCVCLALSFCPFTIQESVCRKTRKLCTRQALYKNKKAPVPANKLI